MAPHLGLKPTYEFIQSPNFTKGRRRPVFGPGTSPLPPGDISAIVIHYTGSMNIEGTISWFKNKEAKVSAHYVIGRDGRVVQMVKEEDIAWHAGRSILDGVPNVNYFSIGIELVATADSWFTDKQLASLYSLLEVLISKYKIQPERVVGHKHVAPGRKIDPDGYENQFNWAKTRNVAQVAFNAATRTGIVNV